MSKSVKVKILGCGPTGLILALSLSRLGCQVDIFESNNLSTIVNKSRAYAISHSSRRLLSQIGLWSYIEKESNSFDKLIIKDNDFIKYVLFDKKDLNLENQKAGSIGWIVDHSNLVNITIAEIRKQDNINIIFDKTGNSNLEDYDFVVAADGVSSNSKIKWGLKDFRFKYDQACITIKVLLRGNKDNIAYEIFRRQGPLAILPIKGDLHQIVWSDTVSNCRQIISYSDSLVLDKLSSLLPSYIEVDCMLDKPAMFPIGFTFPKRLSTGRKFLIGESAHSFHPVGGQGLNLCIRDISLFSKLIKLYLNKLISIGRFSRIYYFRRIIDILSIAIITDFLVRTFRLKFNIFKYIRFLSLILLRNSYRVRRIILNTMTDGILDSSIPLKNK